MDRISDAERQRIAELLADGTPVLGLHQEINRSRHAIRRAVVRCTARRSGSRGGRR